MYTKIPCSSYLFGNCYWNWGLFFVKMRHLRVLTAVVTRTWNRADWKRHVDVRRNIIVYPEDVSSKDFVDYTASYICAGKYPICYHFVFCQLNLKIFYWDFYITYPLHDFINSILFCVC